MPLKRDDNAFWNINRGWKGQGQKKQVRKFFLLISALQVVLSFCCEIQRSVIVSLFCFHLGCVFAPLSLSLVTGLQRYWAPQWADAS